MPLVVLRIGSVLWAWLLRLLAGLGHARAQARVAIRKEGRDTVLQSPDVPRMWFHVSSLGEWNESHPCDAGLPRPSPRHFLVAHALFAVRMASPEAKGVAARWWRGGEKAMSSPLAPDDLPGTWRTWLEALNLRGLAMAKYDLWAQRSAACPRKSRSHSRVCRGAVEHAANPRPPRRHCGASPRPSACRDDAAANAFAHIGLKDSASVDGDPRVERVLTRSANPEKVWTRLGRFGGTRCDRRKPMAEEGTCTGRSADWHPQRRLDGWLPHDISEPHLADLDRRWEEAPFVLRHGRTWA